MGVQLNDVLREAVRVEAEREIAPGAAIIDSQRGKTSAVAGDRGFDGANLVAGRKRYILVDVIGLILAVLVHKASIQEREDVKSLLRRAKQI